MSRTPVKVSLTMLPRNMSTSAGARSTGVYPVTSFSTDHRMPSGDGSGVEVLKTVTTPISSQPSRSNGAGHRERQHFLPGRRQLALPVLVGQGVQAGEQEQQVGPADHEEVPGRVAVPRGEHGRVADPRHQLDPVALMLLEIALLVD